VTAHTEGDRGFPGNGRTLCRGSVRVPRGGERGGPIAFRDKGSLGARESSVSRGMMLGQAPKAAAERRVNGRSET
jgi:hypothetical protein